MLPVAWEHRDCLCMPSARKWFVSVNAYTVLLFYWFYMFKIIIAEAVLHILVPGCYFVQLHIAK